MVAKFDISKRAERGADSFEKRLRPKKGRPFCDEVKALRASLGLTQEEFCRRYQIKLGNLRNWEQASKNVVPDTAARLLIGMISVEPERVAKIVEKATRAQSEKSLQSA